MSRAKNWNERATADGQSLQWDGKKSSFLGAVRITTGLYKKETGEKGICSRKTVAESGRETQKKRLLRNHVDELVN